MKKPLPESGPEGLFLDSVFSMAGSNNEYLIGAKFFALIPKGVTNYFHFCLLTSFPQGWVQVAGGLC